MLGAEEKKGTLNLAGIGPCGLEQGLEFCSRSDGNPSEGVRQGSHMI